MDKMIKLKHANIVENTQVTNILLSNNEVSTLEFPGIIKDLKMMSNAELRTKFDRFLTVYSEYINIFGENHQGMSSPGLFCFWYTLDTLKPTYVLYYGIVSSSFDTWMIKRVIPECKTIYIGANAPEYRDNTGTYLVGDKYIDFKQFDYKKYIPEKDLNDTLVFINSHENALVKLMDAQSKGFKHIYFNDNYPQNCGSHLTIQHVYSNSDDRFSTKQERFMYSQYLMKNMINLHIYPNIIGNRVQTGEGVFFVNCIFETLEELKEKLYKDKNAPDQIVSFNTQSLRYRWSTYVKLK